MLTLDEIADNFRKEIDKENDSKEKVLRIIEFATNYFDTIGDRCQPFYDQALKISRKIGYSGGEAMALLNRAFLHYVNNDPSRIGESLNRVNALMADLKTQPDEYIYVLNLLAYSHWFRGEFDKGFDRIFESFKIADQVKDLRYVGWLHYALGVFYFDTKDLVNSEEHYKKAEDYFLKLESGYGNARSKNGIGSVKIRAGRPEEAVPYLRSAADFYRKGSYYAGLARTLNDLALIEKANANYDQAIQFLNESLEMRKMINHTQGLITTYTELGELYSVLNKQEETMKALMEGLRHSESINAKYKSIRLHKLISDSYKKSGNLAKAFEHFEKFHFLKEEVLSEESANNIRNMQTKSERDRSELINQQKMILEAKQKEILDSIHYAKRIQRSLLPTDSYIDKNLKRLRKNR